MPVERVPQRGQQVAARDRGKDVAGCRPEQRPPTGPRDRAVDDEPVRRLDLNTGADGSDHVGLDPVAEPAHWFVIDRSIARARGRALFGPLPRDVLAPVPRGEVLAALGDSLDWHAAHESTSPNSVLNACRAWRWTRTGRWTSKRAAAEWARDRMSDPAAIDAALVAQAAGGALDAGMVAGFVDAVRAVLAAARP